MKLATFFEKFDQFADAPDAVAKMRELILELAAAGRLLPQLLERPVEEDISLLEEVADLVMGQAPPGDECNTNGLGTTFVKVGEFGPLYPSEVVWTTNPLKFAKRGDVLICVVGATVGKLNLAIDCAIGRSVAAIRPSSVVETKFLYYSLMPYTLRLRRSSRGSAQGVIGKAELNAVSLWIPSVSVQKNVVAKVDELIALCDRLEAQQKEREVLHVALNRAAIARFDEAPTPANLNLLFHGSYTIAPTELRKVILNLAIQGKLVEQNPEDVPAISTFKKLAGYAIDIAENELPAQWMLVPLGKMGEWRGGGTPSKSNTEFWAGEIPWVSPKDMKVLRIADSEDHISEAAIRSSSVKMVPTGSVLMVVRGMILARAFPVALTLRDVTINQDMKSLFPLEQETRDFLLITLRAMEATILSAVERSSHGTCKLRTEILESIQIPIPPLAEQLRICAKVDQLMKLVDQLEARLTASAEAGIELLDAVVHELLRAAANVIEFASSESDQASRRAAVGCYVIEHLVRNPNFGRTMLMKVCYLSETHLDVPLGWKPMRQAAGPYDPEIETLELSGTRNGWFTVAEKALSSGRTKYEYLVKDRLKAKAAEATSVLGERKVEFDRLLRLFAKKNTEEAEIIATLFAAWNDLLIDGMSPSGDDIIREVRENWHPQKERFSVSLLQQWLDWMRRNRLIPKGYGPRTIQQLKLALK
jgi:type I restriction enzyme S subunit